MLVHYIPADLRQARRADVRIAGRRLLCVVSPVIPGDKVRRSPTPPGDMSAKQPLEFCPPPPYHHPESYRPPREIIALAVREVTPVTFFIWCRDGREWSLLTHPRYV